MDNIFSYIRQERSDFNTKTIPVPGIGEWSQKDHVDKTDRGWSDHYDNDDAYDDVIGDFPYENIHKAPTLLEARATDFDQKHIENVPKNGSRKARIASMIVTKALANHHEKIKFGMFMNEVSYIRAKYGGTLVTKEGENVVVKKWQRTITDQADIISSPSIDLYYMTPSELSKMEGWKNVEAAIKGAEEFRNQSIEDSTGTEEAESTGKTIEIFSVEGDLPLSLLLSAQADMNGETYMEQEDDKYKYVYARIIVCGADWFKEISGKKVENGIVFYAESEDKPLRKYIARNPIAGRGLGESVPEVLFEAQREWNFTITEEKRMTAIAGKKLYVTDDPDILDNIFDTGVDHGTVLRVSANKSLTELNQIPSGLPIYQSRRAEIKDNSRELTSYFQANSGAEAKANVPFRAQYLQNLEGNSQFEQYREELGFFYKEIVEDWTMPDALKKAASDDEIYSTFTPQELQLIDEVIVESRLTDELVKMTLEKKVVDPMMVEELRMNMQSQLKKEGSKRTITDIKEFIKEAGKEVRIHTTDEARNKAVLFESYANLLQLLDPQDPRFAALIDKVMQALGITKEELELYADQSLQAQQGQLKQEQLAASQQPKAQAAVAQLGQ